MTYCDALLSVFLIVTLLRWWWDACSSPRVNQAALIRDSLHSLNRTLQHPPPANEFGAKELMEYTEKMFKEFTTAQALKAPKETLSGLAAFLQQRRMGNAPAPANTEQVEEVPDMGRNTLVDKS